MSSGTPYLRPRIDFLLIADLVEADTRVLDIGCGEGELLALLAQNKRVDGRGIELGQDGVNACVARGLSVVQGDADTDLQDYPDDGFDYLILSQTIQATRNPRRVLREMKRIGRHAIVSFPNFGHWRIRLQLAMKGRMPRTDTLAYQWYDTPNIHLCTIQDFVTLCALEGLAIQRAVMLSGKKSWIENQPGHRANLIAEQAIFLLSR